MPEPSRTKKALACTQWASRSVREKRLRYSGASEAIGAAHPRVDVVAALLPVSGRHGVAHDDALDPLDVLVAVHLGDDHPHGRPVLAREWLAVHLIGEHRVVQLRLAQRER